LEHGKVIEEAGLFDPVYTAILVGYEQAGSEETFSE
jgi:hypothetical protein